VNNIRTYIEFGIIGALVTFWLYVTTRMLIRGIMRTIENCKRERKEKDE